MYAMYDVKGRTRVICFMLYFVYVTISLETIEKFYMPQEPTFESM